MNTQFDHDTHPGCPVPSKTILPNHPSQLSGLQAVPENMRKLNKSLESTGTVAEKSAALTEFLNPTATSAPATPTVPETPSGSGGEA